MIVIDIGNTNIVLGIFFKKKIKKIIRLNNKDEKIVAKLKKYFNSNSIKKLQLDYKACVISSVSIFSEKKIINFFRLYKFKIYNINLNNISGDTKFNYVINQLGADRIANTFASIAKYGKNSIVVDFGTATTFDVVINNVYHGGLITPGIKTSLDSLILNTSKLKKVSIIKTKKIIGQNTKTSMQTGFYWGYIGLINGILDKINQDKNIKFKVILTGGLASNFKDDIKYSNYYDPNLTLDGLYLIGQKKYVK